LLLNTRSGGWFSADGEYGSGLSSAVCPPTTPGYCKQTPHTTFNVEQGIPIARKTVVTVGIQNVFNDRYFVTLLNAQGNHFASPRVFTVGVRIGP
jgi:outer membrane receptor protein involved in Fe transport